ncbi:MAG: hypothetical protein ACP5QT_00205 [Brevinematia bacterium]
MRKRISLILGLLIFFVNFLFSAVVSERNEIAVFPVFSSYELPSGAARYFDDKLIEILNSMKRFEVIGYQYRLDYTSAERFIQKIQELKKQALMKDQKYMDEDLGVVVIPAAEMEKLVNSFFIFIPSITGFHTREYQIEVKTKEKGRIKVRIVTEYEAVVNISVKIITSEGKLLDTYNSSQKATSQRNPMEAYQSAVNSAIGGLGFYLRNIEEFKIKSGILKVVGNSVYFELGGNRGIAPGHEYVIQKEEKFMDKFKEKVVTGLVRVRETKSEYSIATVIWGSPEVGDQLVEAPMAGARFNIWAGMFPMKVQSDNLEIRYISPGLSFVSKEKFSKSVYAFSLGLDLEGEIGYAFLLDLKMGFYFSNPFSYNFNFGLGYELYFGRFSATIGSDLSFVGLYKYLGTFENNSWNGIDIKGTTFYEDIDVSLFGGTFGVKPNITINFQPSQRFKIRAFGGYALYFVPYYQLQFTERSSDDEKKSQTVDVTDSSVSFFIDGNETKTFPIDFSGIFGGVEIIFRF